MGRTKRTLQLDRENRKFLGVCAGVANFLEVEATSVRLVFLVCCIFAGWFLVPLYFIAWFLLDESAVPVRETFTNNLMVNHFKSVDYRKKIYRNKRDAKIWGVCAGIADYLEINVFAVRMAFLVLVFMTGIPVLLYVGAALVLDEKPESMYDTEPAVITPQARPWPGAAQTASAQQAPPARAGSKEESRTKAEGGKFSKRREFQYCAHKFATLHARLARLEAYVTSSRFKLHREFKNIS